MKIKRIHLTRYKRVEEVDLQLMDVNVLVGGNNSGKSSVLQGIHFAVTAATTARQRGEKTFAAELLPYNPTPDFSVLRHGTPYLNFAGTGDSTLDVYADIVNDAEADEETSYSVTLSKGRNYGNIACTREGDYLRLGSIITDPNNLFSIYVPGLAGIAQQEELRAKAIVRRGVASGDANLYLRNILYYIKQENKLAELNAHIATIFPNYRVEVEFDESKDTRLNVLLCQGEVEYPLELAGTGFLQVLQIYSYVTYFSPKLLLLDEPDSHLHPDNQLELCRAITSIAQTTDSQVLLCTHSRHVVDELSDEANFIWLKDGTIQDQGADLEKLPLLLDLGALDSFDRLRAGQVPLLVLTEDQDKQYLHFLLRQNGFVENDYLIYSYRTSSNLEGVILFVDFLSQAAPLCRVMIHRDRDFMTDAEVAIVEEAITQAGAIPFTTRGSDIESYFVSGSHLSSACAAELGEVEAWLNQLSTTFHNELCHQFTRKRDDIKLKMYRGQPGACPDTLGLLGGDIPLVPDKRKGKFLLRKVRGAMFAQFGHNHSVLAPSPALLCARLQNIRNQIWPAI